MNQGQDSIIKDTDRIVAEVEKAKAAIQAGNIDEFIRLLVNVRALATVVKQDVQAMREANG